MNKKFSFALRIVGYAFILIVIVPGIITLRWLYLPKHKPYILPSRYGLKYKEAKFITKDGVQISGWLVWQRDVSSPRDTNGVVVICHGLGANRDQVLGYATIAAEHGLASLVFDFRGHGLSGGSKTTFGYLEQLDLMAAIDYAKRQTGKQKVFLWGLSMGAATSALVASKRTDVAGAILESPFDSLRNTIAHHTKLYFHLPEYPFAPIVVFWFRLLGGIDVDSVSPVKALSKLKHNVGLLVVGSLQDKRMPPEVIKRVFNAANTQNKQILIAPKGEHAAIMYASPQEYSDAVHNFFKHNLRR